MSAKSEQMRVSAKLRQQGGVAKNLGLGCWAEKRIYTGSLYPAFANCSKNARPGKLTCRWHDDREEAAQQLRASPEASKTP